MCRGCIYLDRERNMCKRRECPYFEERLEFFRRMRR